MSTEVVDKEQAIETVSGEIVATNQAPRQPWDRRPNESSYWYDAFLVYRNLLPHERSILAAYRQHRQELGYTIKSDMVASGEWYKQCVANDWEKRATLYDDYNRQIAEEKAKQAVQDWYVKSRFNLSKMWNDLQVEWNLIEDGNMSRSQVVAATKTIGQQLTPQSPNQSVDVQIILDKLPPDVQTALLHDLRARK